VVAVVVQGVNSKWCCYVKGVERAAPCLWATRRGQQRGVSHRAPQKDGGKIKGVHVGEWGMPGVAGARG
jgi:hypothetical protein